MELVIPTRSMDFDFHGGARPSLANLSSPSTPKGFGNFFFSSAPTSPTRMSQFYQEFDEFLINNGSQKSITEEATKSSMESAAAAREEDEFAFDFRAHSEKASLSADELFDGGKIRHLKPPPKSPRSSMAPGKNLISAFSPRRKKSQERERGRDRTPAALPGSSSGRRSGATRSLSPLRVSEFSWEEEEQQQQQNNKHLLIPVSKQPAASTATLSSSSSKGSGRKWRLRDFLLFRSASEGRATDKDPFRKYSAFRKQEDFQNANFRSGEGSGSSRRRGPVSAHELHYTVNRAVSEDLRKKTFLPYKQGILGRLAFNPAVHALANGFGSLSRS